ncbi:MAG: 4-(cytidine 5'-diphospho)-2-C-methyl-D-erythritol kinase [Pseudomonadota bacterium]
MSDVRAPGVTVQAPAKVNLSLRVHGRRADGYHELTSLVAFADLGDELRVSPSKDFALEVDGASAASIDGENLIARAASLLRTRFPSIAVGQVHLEKRLPVGAGLGGGSADVAAYLRAVRTLNADNSHVSSWSNSDWSAIALELGADVPVCLHGESTWMCGIGERLIPLATPLPPTHIVLVNPNIMVPTGPVFAALDAQPLDAPPALPPAHFELADLTNDLELPALQVAPGIAAARDALERASAVRAVRMSGSGATYFGVFLDRETAAAAAAQLRAQHPDWWIEAATLGAAKVAVRSFSSHG